MKPTSLLIGFLRIAPQPYPLTLGMLKPSMQVASCELQCGFVHVGTWCPTRYPAEHSIQVAV